ncbi:MAG: HAD family hydrolase [Thermodesulfobacteriota bacterium]
MPADALQALVFDFDGTLAELNIDFAALGRQVRALARRRGYADEWPAGYLLEQVEAVAAALGNGFAAEAQALIQAGELEAAGRGRLFAHARPLLTAARRRGLGVAVISRNCGPAIRRVFPEIDRAVGAFLPREAVERVKPDPAHALAALEVLGAASRRAALIGDHPVDLATAHAAGCLAVGVASGRVDLAGLAAAGADLVLPDASGLLEALAAQGWL